MGLRAALRAIRHYKEEPLASLPGRGVTLGEITHILKEYDTQPDQPGEGFCTCYWYAENSKLLNDNCPIHGGA